MHHIWSESMWRLHVVHGTAKGLNELLIVFKQKPFFHKSNIVLLFYRPKLSFHYVSVKPNLFLLAIFWVQKTKFFISKMRKTYLCYSGSKIILEKLLTQIYLPQISRFQNPGDFLSVVGTKPRQLIRAL